MKTVKITVAKIVKHTDLMERFENAIEHACDMQEGMTFLTDGTKPNGFCQSAWETIYPFVKELVNGGGNFFDGWMKNPYSAMISCNDGFRPVSFYLEKVE